MPRKKQPKKERAPRGSGSVYKRKDGRYEARIYLGVGPTGSPRYWRAYAKTEADAVAKRNRAKADQLGGKLLMGEKQTTGEFLTSWLANHKATTRRPTTVTGYESKIRIHLVPRLGQIPLAKLSSQQIQSFVGQLSRARTQPKRPGGATHALSPRTVQMCYAILRAALETAVRWQLIPANPAAFLEVPRVPKREIVPLNDQEAQRLLEAIKGDRLEALYTVALAIGLRQGEALGLRWKDVDLTRQEVRISTALHRQDGVYVLDDIKTERSRRTIPLPAYALAALRAHRARQLADRPTVVDWGNGWDLVFTTKDGRPLNGSWVTHAFQRHVARASLPRQRFYDLRHGCASLLIALGLHPREIMEILGHSQISLTMDLYGHVFGSSLRRAADRMDRFLRTGEIVPVDRGDDRKG